jgi:hypothetical protein
MRQRARARQHSGDEREPVPHFSFFYGARTRDRSKKKKARIRRISLHVPFCALAEVILRKNTDHDNLDQVLQRYIAEALGMDATSCNCSLVKSTKDKPHVSWGICSTGHDVPKLIRVLANRGRTADSASGRIVSAESARQILSFQGGSASSADAPLPFRVPLNNCIGRSNQGVANSLIGYGLGTMITAGVMGQLFAHAATIGGQQVIAHQQALGLLCLCERRCLPGNVRVDCLDR